MTAPAAAALRARMRQRRTSGQLRAELASRPGCCSTGLRRPVPAARTDERFAADVLAMHRRATSATSRGRLQVPWPRALGTPPWAVARELCRRHGAAPRYG